jgi:2-C-methyl-D-erythritol 2,4-cyclodiphosphate synthase
VKVRIGIGFDVHRLALDRKLMLGGIQVPHTKGLVGHSDGDVLLHAIVDALLGACGMGNIGERFPDTDVRYREIDSQVFLSDAAALIRAEGFEIGNIDSNILAEYPRLLPYLGPMQGNIARVLDISRDSVAVKAKTMERLGPIGNGEAIAAQAVAIVYRP